MQVTVKETVNKTVIGYIPDVPNTDDHIMIANDREYIVSAVLRDYRNLRTGGGVNVTVFARPVGTYEVKYANNNECEVHNG